MFQPAPHMPNSPSSPPAGVSLPNPFASQPTACFLGLEGEARQTLEAAALAANWQPRVETDWRAVVQRSESQPTCLLLRPTEEADARLAIVHQFAAETNGLVPLLLVLPQPSVPEVVRLMQSGAFGVLSLPIQPEVARDQLVAARRRADEDAARAAEFTTIKARYERLTAKERDVLRLIEQGQSNRQIAASLDISVRAVEDRRSRAMRRMEASSLVELVQSLHLLGQATPTTEEPPTPGEGLPSPETAAGGLPGGNPMGGVAMGGGPLGEGSLGKGSMGGGPLGSGPLSGSVSFNGG